MRWALCEIKIFNTIFPLAVNHDALFLWLSFSLSHSWRFCRWLLVMPLLLPLFDWFWCLYIYFWFGWLKSEIESGKSPKSILGRERGIERTKRERKKIQDNIINTLRRDVHKMLLCAFWLPFVCTKEVSCMEEGSEDIIHNKLRKPFSA